jgi:hypothetical protein
VKSTVCKVIKIHKTQVYTSREYTDTWLGRGCWVEGGKNLLKCCYVGHVFRIISNIGLFISVKVSNMESF